MKTLNFVYWISIVLIVYALITIILIKIGMKHAKLLRTTPLLNDVKLECTDESCDWCTDGYCTNVLHAKKYC